MQKFLIKISIIVPFIVGACYSLWAVNSQSILPGVMLDNVEALAQGEAGTSYGCCIEPGSICTTDDGMALMDHELCIM